MPETKLQEHWLSIKALAAIARLDIWGGKAGGRHWRLFRCLFVRSLKSASPKMTLSLADMALLTNISSHRGLANSIDFLVEHRLLEVIDRGEPDQHEGQRRKGRPGTYMIRDRGATDTLSCSSTSAVSHSYTPLPSQVIVGRSVGCSPLPNDERTLVEYDMALDLWVKEPHLLRLLDLMAVDGVNYLSGVTPSKLAEILGLSVSGAWEMLKRWTEKAIFFEGTIDLRRVDVHEERKRYTKLSMKVRKAVAIRAAALEGRYMAARWRAQQRVRLVTKWGFQVVDGEWASTIWKMQQNKGERGLVPWLEGCEFAGVA